jgi:hypothetical protein
MGDSRKYFDMDRGSSPSSHWLPANAAPFQIPGSANFESTSFDFDLDSSKFHECTLSKHF